jgi:osmotically-inducible protein OsmY
MLDIELRQNVMDELTWEPMVDPAEIGVAVTDDVVTLSGYVDSYSEKMAAERAAKRVYGVTAVANEIEVKLPGLMERTDPEIAGAARDALNWSTLVPGAKITVTVQNGWLKLEGKVDWQFQRTEAEDIVRNLTGVKGVTNLISIQEKPKPVQIESDIEKALKRSAEVDARRIWVETDDGRVILHGNVRSWLERREAEDAAWAAPGVTRVENEISVTL